jgi:hypothetical protein
MKPRKNLNRRGFFAFRQVSDRRREKNAEKMSRGL